MLIQIQNIVHYKKHALLFLFVTIHFGIHAMQSPIKLSTVGVSFPNERTGNDHIPVLTIDTDRFPFFAAAKKWSEEGVVKLEDVSFDAMRILKNLDTVIAGNESKKIETSFKLGTYNIPPTIRDQLSEDTISIEGLQTLIHSTDFINRPDLASLILYEYAARLAHTSIPLKATKKESVAAIRDATFSRELDKQLAKIILDLSWFGYI